MPAIYREFVTIGDNKNGKAIGNNDTDFAFVYIEEAHAVDEWPISSG